MSPPPRPRPARAAALLCAAAVAAAGAAALACLLSPSSAAGQHRDRVYIKRPLPEVHRAPPEKGGGPHRHPEQVSGGSRDPDKSGSIHVLQVYLALCHSVSIWN